MFRIDILEIFEQPYSECFVECEWNILNQLLKKPYSFKTFFFFFCIKYSFKTNIINRILTKKKWIYWIQEFILNV